MGGGGATRLQLDKSCLQSTLEGQSNSQGQVRGLGSVSWCFEPSQPPGIISGLIGGL